MKKVTIGGHINSAINFAMQQNYVPIIRNLVISNESDEKLDNLKLKIVFEPAFAKEFNADIQVLEPGESVEISPVDIRLSTEFLFSITEKMVGNIYIDLYQEETLIYEYDSTIELLAYDQWSGLRVMPEIICAFITPNHPSVAQVLSKAADYLKQWTENPAFTGYQTRNPNNVKLQMAAIYAALQSAQITYNNPPASYESMGQRVRLPHVVLDQKQGTCLDLTLLYAACLEAAGLYPLIVFMKGHAYAGCRLEEETFADCVVDDISALEKRIVKGSEELLLLECVDYTAGKMADFELALKHGNDHLLQPEEFYCVVDVCRSRGSGIRPIPVRLEQARLLADAQDGEINFDKNKTSAPEELYIRKMADLSAEPENLTKQKVWERKLLDFSLRNALLNFRVNKNSLQLMTANLGELEDKLSDGKDFRIMEVPAEWTLSMRDAKMFAIENEKDLIANIAAEEFKNNRIRTFLPEEELSKNLKSIYRAAKVSMEENGTNTLFLALGFLRWFESDLSEKARYAPIVLVPVDIVKSIRNKGYVIRSRQEEAQINITLLEYLRQIFGLKIGGLDPLPMDEHGIDLPLVFHTIRQAIMGKKQWNIENMAFIGLFSFGQFVMWNDIRNRSKELETNKVVSSLIEGKMNWVPDEQTITADNLDVEIKPDKMAIPLSADSSQMVAIAAAAQGQSFVLHGPPGTGKSQTITNMIANALYQGKSVLFVAEKMAALNVVKNRLTKIGLEPFCLELHSNKTNKSNVLKQLNQALEVGRIKAPEEYQAAAERLYALRKELNDVVEALHCRREYGCTLYEAIEIYETGKNQKGKIMTDSSVIQSASKEQILQWQDMLRQFSVAVGEVPAYSQSPLKAYGGKVYSLELREQLEQLLGVLLSKMQEHKLSLQTLSDWMGLDAVTRKSIEEGLKIGQIVNNKVLTLSEFILSPNFDGIDAQLAGLCNAGREYNAQTARVLAEFDPQVLNYDVNTALMNYKKAQMSWFLAKATGTNKLVKELKLYGKNPAAITKENLCDYYNLLIAVQNLKAQIENVSSELTRHLSGIYMGLSTDWNLAEAALAKARAVRAFLKTVDAKYWERYVQIISNDRFDPNVTQALAMAQSVLEHVRTLEEHYEISFKAADNSQNWYDGVMDIVQNIASNMSMLKNWTLVQRIAQDLSLAGLGCVVTAWKAGVVNAENLQQAFNCNLYYGLVLKTISNDSRLAQFAGKQYEDMIVQYAQQIDKFSALTIQELVAKLSAQVPISGAAGAASSEVGILKRAIKSNGRMLSIRKLFDEIPTLLRKLCPCMLMSPISVAQYIDPKFPKFDLVIFDEASQLPTSEAVGTIARGENVIVVGDPNQLPPTSFFSSNRVDEDNMDKEDLESLLDDCLSISMPQEHLKWHYRSRHESLIAYSNMKYYDNKLYTFPSPNDLVSEVKLVPVEGYYDKGKTKQNKAEAQAVVDEIIRRLSDEKLRNDSIGVVTFSSVQQHLIDDMLAEAFAKHPELEDFDRASNEPIFIKNLENVQGDERDVILFSVGYGPDQNGNVSMNFGPLNRDGGWRRLNVAISRSRKSMIVYSTLKPEHIDLSRTRAQGVAGLKGFLEFAARGKNALAAKAGTGTKAIDPLVSQLADAIKTMGYDVKCNIGCSAYKMDIGIVHPQKPDTYLLGILLDGENCRDAATSKDRFVLQPSVLQGLGWKIMRVWTLEWLDNPDKVLQEIKNALETAMTQPEEVIVQTNTNPKTELVFEKIDTSQLEKMESVKAPYRSYEQKILGPSEMFYEAGTQRQIIRLAESIIKREAPISRKLLMRKVLSAWGISRSGSRVEAAFNSAVAKVEKQMTCDADQVFFWRPEQNPKTYGIYRVEDQEGNKRSMDDVASQEIINAMKEVLNAQISLTKEDLVRETAKKFGFTRLGTVIENSIGYAISAAEQNEAIHIDGDGKVNLKN